MKLPQSFTTVTPFSKILALALFVTLPFVGFVLGSKYQKNVTILPSCQSDNSNNTKIENCVFQDKTAKIEGVYLDENKNYQLEVPESWLGNVDNGILKMQSPDLLIISEGYGLPVVGAEIIVSEKISNFLDVNEYKKSELDYGIKEGWISNFRRTTVDGENGIQYEWAWEGYGTTTIFIKNGKIFEVTMYYNYDQKSNEKYLEAYNKMLSSFNTI